MSEMVERVERAILAKCAEFESRKGDLAEFDSRELARAAIAAMREPTRRMLDVTSPVDDGDPIDVAKANWQAGIDEALK